MKICSVVTHLCWLSMALAVGLELQGANAGSEVLPQPDTATSTEDADTTTKDSKFLPEDSCPMQREVEDFCPHLNSNVTDLKHKLTGEWVVEFGFVSASTTRAFCQRMIFAAASGPCTAFASGYSPRSRDNNPLPAPSTLRMLQQGLLVSSDGGDPQLKVLLMQEPFMILAVCSEHNPLYILGVRHTTSDLASTSEPPSSLTFWMDVHHHYMQLSGPAWFLCSRLWESGDSAHRGRGYDFTDSSTR